MLNITPDTRFHWTGGCWSAIPGSQQDAKPNSHANPSAPAQSAVAHASGGGHHRPAPAREDKRTPEFHSTAVAA